MSCKKATNVAYRNPASARNGVDSAVIPSPSNAGEVHSQHAVVQNSTLEYDRAHILGWPIELRLVIWKNIFRDTVDERSNWHSRPKNEASGLVLSCRQIYHELQQIGYRHVIPWNRLQTLLKEPFNRTTIQELTSLSLDIRLDAHRGYFTGLDRLLWKAQPYLKELRLHFTGSDTFGTQVYSHGCGNFGFEVNEPKLPIDGQRFMDLLPLWRRIAHLDQLENLVIINANLQTYMPMFLNKKPHLKHLYLSADPRSTVHKQHSAKELTYLLTATPDKEPPPIEVLNISANASPSAHLIAHWTAPTLKHFTWNVPDPSLQWNACIVDWYSATFELMLTLGARATKLETLRVCAGGPGIYSHDSYGSFYGAFLDQLPQFKTLKHFEIHLKARSYWFGKQMLARLPPSVEHVYLSDRTIHPVDLLYQIWQRYLVVDIKEPVQTVDYADIVYHKGASSHPKPTRAPIANNYGRLSLPMSTGPWIIDAKTFRYPELGCKEISGDSGIMRHGNYASSDGGSDFVPGYNHDRDYINAYRTDTIPTDLIGENRHRHDCIPLTTGRMRFIHFEYDDEQDEQPPEEVHATTTLQKLLLINGRLLDRYRNRHLAGYNRGSRIPPRLSGRHRTDIESCSVTETATHSANLSYSVLLHRLHESAQQDAEKLSQIEAEWKKSRFCQNFDSYFGTEDQAMDIFHREAVAQHDQLEPLLYVVEKPVHVDGKCHWLCPDARRKEE